MRLAIAGIAISVAVMITSIAILFGFKTEILKKVTGFGMHVQVRALEMNNSYESSPIPMHPAYLKEVEALKEVSGIFPYINKPCILKTDSMVEGLVLKGVSSHYDYSFLQQHLTEGKLLSFTDSNYSKDIIISSYIARKLHLSLNDKISLYFLQEPVRVRQLKVCGIYETGLEDYDRTFAVIDLRMLQKLNGWDTGLVQGFEVKLKNIEQLDSASAKIDEIVDVTQRASSIKELKPQIFDWLALLDMNVIIIIVLMIIVSTINMITALLILILERTPMIGLLKALGSRGASIKRIFLLQAAYIIGWGAVIGNVLAAAFYFLQKQTGFFKLDPELYYLNKVPLEIGWTEILMVNAGSMLLCLIAMLLPVTLIVRISPVRALKFD